MLLADRDKVLEGLERGADASGVKKQLSALLSQVGPAVMVCTQAMRRPGAQFMIIVGASDPLHWKACIISDCMTAMVWGLRHVKQAGNEPGVAMHGDG